MHWLAFGCILGGLIVGYSTVDLRNQKIADIGNGVGLGSMFVGLAALLHLSLMSSGIDLVALFQR